MSGGKRFSILLLVALCMLVLVRLLQEPPPPRGAILLDNLEPASLSLVEFEVPRTMSVVVRATGSLDQRYDAEGLAAQGWILNQESRELVWQMQRAALTSGRGGLVHVEGDTLQLEAGRYGVYFSSFGQLFRRVRGPFRKERKNWRVLVQGLEEDATLSLLPGMATPGDSGVVWSAAPLDNDERREFTFEVHTPVELDVYAVGQITAFEDLNLNDYSWIEEAESGEHVWNMWLNNTSWGGGIEANRVFRGQMELQPGVYRAVARTDRRHAFDDWEGNPPFDPYAWGLTLKSEESSSITVFDPWVTRQPIIAFTRVTDDEHRSQVFDVTRPTTVVIHAMGEFTGASNAYDFAWLDEVLPGSQRRYVWSMLYENTMRAGGNRKNRMETAFLSLEPGRYELNYASDGSHSYESWNADRPNFPDRWGVSVFPVAAELADGTVVLVEDEVVQDLSPVGEFTQGDAVVADWMGLGSSINLSQPFQLETTGVLYILAIGEILKDGTAYDYGWITRNGEEEPIWAMNWDNTSPAGGDSSNRQFEGEVMLGPGNYVLHFTTDESHHYGGFDGEAPQVPEQWGIRAVMRY